MPETKRSKKTRKKPAASRVAIPGLLHGQQGAIEAALSEPDNKARTEKLLDWYRNRRAWLPAEQAAREETEAHARAVIVCAVHEREGHEGVARLPLALHA